MPELAECEVRTVTTVVFSPPRVVDHPNVGGHFWEYMQYAHGLRQVGCDVWWMERVSAAGDPRHGVDEDLESRVATFLERIAAFGMSDRVILYTDSSSRAGSDRWTPLTLSPIETNRVIGCADLFVNFDYRIDADFVALFKRSALVDIDPGLLQFWVHHNQIDLPPHDVYFTTGETVGTPHLRFPECGLPWVRIPPAVALDLWPYVTDSRCDTFTTVSSWWGDEWITDGKDHYENNKRVSFLEYWDLPRRSGAALELALFLGPGDAADIARLESGGWRVRHSGEVARTPSTYQRYIQQSRGEFSCAKPSCMKFQNAWISDRTLCYLASGKPAIVQHTGPSSVLPSAEGLFRFSSMDEALAALEEVNANYEQHGRAARDLIEEHFDATSVARTILDVALSDTLPGLHSR